MIRLSITIDCVPNIIQSYVWTLDLIYLLNISFIGIHGFMYPVHKAGDFGQYCGSITNIRTPANSTNQRPMPILI